ncbi:MFS transporter, partial [Lawsonella clevelandensis]
MSLFTKNADPLALSTITPELKKARAADSVAFAIQAMLMVALLTSLPSLMPLLGISASKIALVVLALSAFSAAGSVVITIVASKTSSAFAIRVALALLILASFGLTFGPASPGNSKLPVFIICTIFYGFAVGALDATTNMQAVA